MKKKFAVGQKNKTNFAQLKKVFIKITTELGSDVGTNGCLKGKKNLARRKKLSPEVSFSQRKKFDGGWKGGGSRGEKERRNGRRGRGEGEGTVVPL